MQRSLLLGCGNSREKKVYLGDAKDWTGELTTVDMNPNCGADVVMDLSQISQFARTDELVRFPFFSFPDETFDELAAYDVLEHWGRQGDWAGFFTEFAEYHRILKPGGLFGIIVPIGEDALADPGHARFFHRVQFGFLNQKFYADNLAKGAQVTDYRWYWKLNFEIEHCEEQGNHLYVLLRKA